MLSVRNSFLLNVSLHFSRKESVHYVHIYPVEAMIRSLLFCPHSMIAPMSLCYRFNDPGLFIQVCVRFLSFSCWHQYYNEFHVIFRVEAQWTGAITPDITQVEKFACAKLRQQISRKAFFQRHFKLE